MHDYKLSKKANEKWISFIHRDLSNYHPLDYKSLGEFIIQTIKDDCEVDIGFVKEELESNQYNKYSEKLIQNYTNMYEDMSIMARIIFNIF